MRSAEFLSPTEPSEEMVFLFHGVCFAGITKAQRQAILERDGHKSQMRHYDENRGWFTGPQDYCQTPQEPCPHLEVNHIKPRRESQSEGVPEDQYNHPLNLLTISKCEHVGYCPSGKIRDEIAIRRGDGKKK